jgi:hypothetical protein
MSLNSIITHGPPPDYKPISPPPFTGWSWGRRSLLVDIPTPITDAERAALYELIQGDELLAEHSAEEVRSGS